MKTYTRLGLIFGLLFVFLVGCTSPNEHNPTSTADRTIQPVAERTQTATSAELAALTTALENHIQTESTQYGALATPLESFYEKQQYQLAWAGLTELRPEAKLILKQLLQSEDEGLDPYAYQPDQLREAYLNAYTGPAFDADALAALDVQLSNAFMRYAEDLLRGHLDPRESDAEVYVKPAPVALDSVLHVLATESSEVRLGTRLRPAHPQYNKLRDALDTYRTYERAGGWEAIPDLASGEVVEPGQRDSRIPLLRERLATTGDLAQAFAADTSTALTGSVLDGLAHFQKRHGLAVDSVLGPATLAALNISVDERVRQIELGLERWRWLPTHLGDRYVLVNLPEFKLHAYDNGEEVLNMPVVIGAEWGGRRTPVFSDEMTHVIFHPYWNVPVSITRGEIVPNVYNDASYLDRKGYELINVNTGAIAPNNAVPIDEIGSTYRVRQRSGPSNALGLVKFMFPNRHSIYLHDSPSKHLYDDTKRAYSHGCIRLADPPAFAEYVLGTQGWDERDVQAAYDAGERERVNLDANLPVYIMYLTSFVGDDGTVFFREDLYNYDQDLSEVMDDVRAASAPLSDSPIQSLLTWLDQEA